MASPTTTILEQNTKGALRHMFETVRRHPYITFGIATGLAYAVSHTHRSDIPEQVAQNPTVVPTRRQEPADPPDPTTSWAGGPTAQNMVHPAFVASPGIPPPNLAGYHDPSIAHIQMNNTGYDNPMLAPNALGPLQGGDSPMAMMPMRPSMRMSGMKDTRYQSTNQRVNDLLAMNAF